ncbi:transporter substrate-binding domain-containing protein [Mitsuaria sp. WAJ17]|uniref:substrate-binding periplasmic protein n=1 Tax=Mitsuaria sp. WAJ17 TaxID=2761452 RepID=UPI0016022132|nr:transporter substrate-binding domain-containing protein [Mitsuaria sp. WAJ17]MBB2485971.1 transporter substrate-binding domain-containing protein [Mitsuaria sp. WAJ17]
MKPDLLRAGLLAWALGAFGGSVALAAPPAPPQVVAVTEPTSYAYMEQGQLKGNSVAFVELSLRRAGLQPYQSMLVPWARAYDMALKEPNVLIYLLARTPEREPLFEWVGELLRLRYRLYGLKAREDLQLHSMADARDLRVGVVRDDVRHQRLKALGFTRLVVSSDISETLRQLRRGQVDLVPMGARDLAENCRLMGLDCAQFRLVLPLPELDVSAYMAFSRGTPVAKIQALRKAYEALRREGQLQQMMGEEP